MSDAIDSQPAGAMNSLLRPLFVLGLGAAFTLAACEGPIPSDPDPDPGAPAADPGAAVPGLQDRDPLDRHIVGLETGHAGIGQDAADEVYRVLDFGDIGVAVSGWFADEALEALQRNPRVRYIEEEGVMEAHHHTVGEDEGDPTEVQVLPWGIARVDADVAHHEGETGGGSSIAILDTGIDPNHETLVVTGGEAFVSCRGRCAEDWDDDHGHGTHVAGTANAADNEIGVVGVSTAAELYAVKVLNNSGSGTWSDVAAGIEWTADQGIHVANLSLGGGHSETVQNAVESADGKGTLIVASAGNSGPDDGTVGYPAAYEQAIAVSATDQDDDIASFSSRGEEVELAAPGVSVLSSLPGDDYGTMNGTSMSAPHVAGAAAQLMEHGYTNGEARSRLNDTAEDIGLDDNEQGNGLLDVAAALGITVDDDDDAEEEPSLSVETREASDVGETSATLNGELTELEGFEQATVYFEWGESGEGFPRTTDQQTLESTGEFEETLTELEPDTEYEFRAVAKADDEDAVGDDLSFTTHDDGEEVVEAEPQIEEFEASARTTGPWYRADVEWTVSHEDGALESVTTELLDGDAVLDSQTSSVSGDLASGEHNLRTRDSGADAVRITVTDTDGNEVTDEQTISF